MIKGRNLIFIISQPRSGSTLTQKLLSNNDMVDTASEPWLLLPYLSVFRDDLIKASYHSNVAKEGILDYLDKKDLKDQYSNSLREFLLKLYPVSPGKSYFIDKTPRYYEILDEIYALFPQAKYLILKRSPFASLYSMLETWSGFKTDFDSLSAFYRDFLIAPQNIQNFYSKYNSKNNVFQIRYEDMVADPSKYVKTMYDWAEIPFTDDVLNIGRNEKVKGIYGDDVYKKQAAATVEPDKNADWLNKIKPDKKVFSFFGDYAAYLGKDFIESYGYDYPVLKSSGGILAKSDFKKLTDKVISELKN